LIQLDEVRTGCEFFRSCGVYGCPAFAKVKDEILQRDFRLNGRYLDHDIAAGSEWFRERTYDSLIAENGQALKLGIICVSG
jgi:hypothetical protein